ncbi:hypothetical protein, partial [Brachyspira catarrhinii]|uniref:hypothetical protein n=1 Tax=Brachyspira catarrhinii TaxID=2528966 RepID=UPI001F330BD0
AKNPFKTFLITLLSLTLLLSISCSNEDTTGVGGDTGNNGNTEDNYNFTVSEDWGNSYYNDITLISETSSSSVYSAGTIGFKVVGATDYTVSIESVTKYNMTSLTLGASDFSYNQSSKDLRLSSSGLTKFQQLKDSFTETQKYSYRITFKIATSSESTNFYVDVNLIKAKLITKTEIETIMKTVKRKSDWLISGTPNAGEIIIADTSSSDNTVKFSFASASFSSSSPNFSATGTTTTSSSSATIATSKAAETLEGAINDNTEFAKYFSNFLGVESSTTPSVSGKDCTFTLKFKTLKSGHALSKEVEHLTTTGLTIKLTLDSKASWQQ